MDVSEKINNLIAERGISRYKLAKESAVPYTTLVKILDGVTKNPQIDSLKLIADYFGKPLDYFMGEQDDSAPDWATSRDKRDLKRMLEDEEPVMFDGVPIADEDKEKIKRVMEAMFWDAREKNKKTYGRKKTKPADGE